MPSHYHCYPFDKGWEIPKSIDIVQDYEEVLRRIASGQFQELVEKVKDLTKEVERLKGIKKVLITEEALIEVWDDEYDDWWDSA